MRTVWVAIGLVALTFGLAFGTHPGSSSAYQVLGFSVDGKTAYFKKSLSSMVLGETWHAAYDAATGKQKTSQPTYRNCDPIAGTWDPDAQCDDGKHQIDEKSGKRTVDKLYATHGALSPETLLRPKRQVDRARYLKDAAGSGHVQEFSGKHVEVKAISKLEGKSLPDVSDGSSRTAFFSLELTITGGGDTWTTKTRVYGEPVEDPDNGNVLRWEGLHVHDLAVALDRGAIAFTFAGKPFVIPRSKATRR